MKEVFVLRRQKYYTQNLKYLRFVFNDHFMLFLLIILATLTVQYAQFLQHNTLNFGFRMLIALVVSLIALIPGKLATFLEAADSTFLLVKEEAINKELSSASLRSLIFPSAVIVSLTLIASPAVKFDGLMLAVWIVILLAVKFLTYRIKLRSFQPSGALDWEAMIHYEEVRQTNILKIFALFTNVKGIESRAKRRKYLDFLLPRKKRSAYDYLFWRSFLRAGDYFGMTFRLLLLVLLGLIFISNLISAFLFATIINYLLIFQLLSLAKAHEYQPLLKIYPLKTEQLTQALNKIMTQILLVFIALEYLAMIIATRDLKTVAYGLIFIAASALIFKFYISYRLNQKK